MDKFTENLAEGLRRFAMAGVGAVALTVEKSKEIIDTLVSKGEATAGEGQAALDELQSKMAAQFDAFSKRLRKDYEEASFDSLLERIDALTEEQKEQLIERLQAKKTAEEGAEAPQGEASVEVETNAEEESAPCSGEDPAQPETKACECDEHAAPSDDIGDKN